MKGQRSNCTGVKGRRVVSVRYNQSQQRGRHCIHDPIHSNIDTKEDTGVVGMETNSIINIHFPHFSSPSNSPNMACRHGNYLSDYGRKEINITDNLDA